MALPHRERILAITAALLCMALGTLAVKLGSNYWLLEAEERTQLIAFDQAKNLERNIDRSLAGAKVLATVIELNGGRDDDFDALAESILKGLQGITNLQLAPDGIIAKIYPLPGNEKAIGHNVLVDDKRRAEAQLAVTSRRLTLAGPFTLVQGGVAIIGRQPVFVGNRFWGFASALITMDQVLAMTELNSLDGERYHFKLWRYHPDSQAEQVIAGDAEIADEVSARAPIALPNSTWYLDVGYHKPPLLRAVFGLGFTLSLLISLIVGHWLYNLLSRPRQLQRRVEAKTTELRAANQQLQREKQQLNLFRNAVEQSGNVIIIADRDGLVEYVNPRFSSVSGFSASEVVGQRPQVIKSEFTSPAENRELWNTLLAGQTWRGERRNRRKNGSHYWSLLQISPIRDEHGEITHFLSVSDDITDSKENQLLIEKLAYHDSLTGLNNRRYFIDRLEQAVRFGERHQRCAAVMFLDLDRFKAVNDRFGHQVGDELLIEVAKRLLQVTRKSDLCARLAGDEFTVLLTEVDCVQGVYAVAEKIITRMRGPITIGDHGCDISISIGISLIDQSHQSAGQVLRQADMALYMAKNAGRDQYRVYQAEQSLHETPAD